MLDYTNTVLEKVSVHHVGNKTNGEQLSLSKNPVNIESNAVKELLLNYFLSSFTVPEFYSFTFSNGDFLLNPVFNFAGNIFDSVKSFHKNSVSAATLLYNLSVHPQIKDGDLFVAYFSNLIVGERSFEAVGLFKCENKHAFLKLNNDETDFFIDSDEGINIEKLDKGCLIFNTDRKNGFRVCVVDRTTKSAEAQYWKESFLQLKPYNDNYHHTSELMNITKAYAAKQYAEEFEINKADQIDLLNRSADYFKTHEKFDRREFENQILQEPGIIKSFRKFDTAYRENNNLELEENFEISEQAFKNQKRIFKSVLKLDKNFHIYIHGDRNLIEHGVDDDGRKFYKVYYQEEH